MNATAPISEGGGGCLQPAAGAESGGRDERSRAGSRSVLAKWRPAEADGWRKRGASPCLRARAARSAGSTMARRNSAARGVSSWRSETGQLPSGRLPGSSGAQVCAGCRFAPCDTRCVAFTGIETLRFGVRSNVSQVKSNVATLRKWLPLSRLLPL